MPLNKETKTKYVIAIAQFTHLIVIEYSGDVEKL